MRFSRGLRNMLAIWLLSHSLTGSAQPDNAAPATSVTKTTTKNSATAPYSGYSVDGRTSASVLTAKRSHSVSKQDETGLAVYSGLMVIGLIVFFVQTLSKKK